MHTTAYSRCASWPPAGPPGGPSSGDCGRDGVSNPEDMTMRLRDPVLLILGALFASAGGAALANTPAAAASTGGDVTMTVIPSGADVVKSVVQNIVVPANADKVAKNKSAESQKVPAAEQTAQQLAE